MDDTQLLYDYVETGNETAFAELVRRHIDMVYAAARRQTRDAHLAQDVTQAVFIVLARKAAKVRNGGVLSAWLLSSTRYAASNAMAIEQRRRRHETKAAAMQSIEGASPELEAEQDDPMVATLDQAMARLGEADRSAVAMRYLQDKTFVEVAAAMKITEEAARKRVDRAVQKLRAYFSRRGVTLDGTQLDSGLLAQMRQMAPAALAPLVTAKALSAKSLAALGTVGASGLIAGEMIRSLTWMTSAKIAVAACAAVVITGAVVVQSRHAAAQRQVATPTAPVILVADPSVTIAPAPLWKPVTLSAVSIWQPYVPSVTPGTDVVEIKNDSLQVKPNNDYSSGLDPDVRRGADPAAMMSSSSPAATRVSMARQFDVAPYRGRRIRLSGFVKSTDVELASGIGLWVYGADGTLLAQDDLGGRWVHGTTEWARQDIVSDVPEQATEMYVTGYLRGPGTVWIDGMELAVVGKDVPVNDDHRWRGWTATPAKYQTSLDKKVLHNGHPTICLSSETAVPNDWVTYDHTEVDVRPFLGKKVKLTVMIKSENVVGSAGPLIRAVAAGNKTAKRDAFSGKRPVVKSMNWATYSTTMDFPRDAVDISYGVTLNGKGKVWFDELRFEVLGEARE